MNIFVNTIILACVCLLTWVIYMTVQGPIWLWSFVNHIWVTCGCDKSTCFEVTCESHVVLAHVNHMWYYYMWITCEIGTTTCGSHVAHMWYYYMWITCGTTTCGSHVTLPHVDHMWFTCDIGCSNFTCESHVIHMWFSTCGFFRKGCIREFT